MRVLIVAALASFLAACGSEVPIPEANCGPMPLPRSVERSVELEWYNCMYRYDRSPAVVAARDHNEKLQKAKTDAAVVGLGILATGALASTSYPRTYRSSTTLVGPSGQTWTSHTRSRY